MADGTVFPEGTSSAPEDNITEETLGSWGYDPNTVDYKVNGLGVTANFSANEITVATGRAIIGYQNRRVKVDLNTGETKGLAASSGDNFVYLEFDPNSLDTIAVEVYDSEAASPNHSLQVGYVDAANSEVEQRNPNPDATFDDTVHDSVATEEVNNTRTPDADSDLQSIIDDLGDGGTIRLRSNTTYALPAGLVVDGHDNFTIEGPRSAVLELDGSLNSDETILTIGGSEDTYGVTVRGVAIDASTQSQPSGTLSNHNTKAGCGILIDADGVDVVAPRIENVGFIGTKNEAVGLFSSQIRSATFGDVVDCTFESIEGYAAIHPHNDHTLRIHENTFRNFTSPVEHIIRHGYEITSNIFENCHTDHYALRGTQESSLITTNTFRDVSGIPGVIDGWGSGRDIISDNVFQQCDSTHAIIRARNGGDTIKDNLFDDCLVRVYQTDSDGTRFIGNEIIDCGDSRVVWVFENSGMAIKDNRIAGSGFDVGLEIEGSGHKVIGNDVEGAAVSNYDFSATGNDTIARENLGRSGEITLDQDGDIPWWASVVLLDGSSNTVNASLPDPSAWPGEEIIIKAIDVSNAVQYSQNGSETIDGGTSQTLSSQYEAHTVRSDGSNWFIVNQS